MDSEQPANEMSLCISTNQSGDHKNGYLNGEASKDPSKEWLHSLWWQVSNAQEEKNFYDR